MIFATWLLIRVLFLDFSCRMMLKIPEINTPLLPACCMLLHLSPIFLSIIFFFAQLSGSFATGAASSCSSPTFDAE